LHRGRQALLAAPFFFPVVFGAVSVEAGLGEVAGAGAASVLVEPPPSSADLALASDFRS
jgi:hypothetical protein